MIVIFDLGASAKDSHRHNRSSLRAWNQSNFLKFTERFFTAILFHPFLILVHFFETWRLHLYWSNRVGCYLPWTRLVRHEYRSRRASACHENIWTNPYSDHLARANWSTDLCWTLDALHFEQPHLKITNSWYVLILLLTDILD